MCNYLIEFGSKKLTSCKYLKYLSDVLGLKPL
jgi:hypothetical protein